MPFGVAINLGSVGQQNFLRINLHFELFDYGFVTQSGDMRFSIALRGVRIWSTSTVHRSSRGRLKPQNCIVIGTPLIAAFVLESSSPHWVCRALPRLTVRSTRSRAPR